MKEMRRRHLLAATGAALATSASAALWIRHGERHCFEVTHTPVHIPGLPRPLRLLHLADFHVSDGMTAPELLTGLELGLKSKPDLICLTGDFVSTTHGFDRPGLLDLLKRCAQSAPTFATLGNHDGGDWMGRFGGHPHTELLREILHQSGLSTLHNTHTQFAGLQLAGLGDLWARELFAASAFQSIDPSLPTLLLSHNPDSKDAVEDLPWHLMLSGHTHGGQGRIPFVTPAWAPVKDKRFLSGLYPWQSRQLFITRGLGSPKGVRANCRPEVSLLELA
jgi:uncharacterized protein